MEQEAYEIYAFKDDKWSSDSVHHQKNLAISLAVTLLNKTDHSAIRVLKKKSSIPENIPFGTVIYKESEEAPHIPDRAWEAVINRIKEKRLQEEQERLKKEVEEAALKHAAIKKSMAKAGKEKSKKVYRSVFKLVLVAGASFIAVMAAGYFLLDYFGKL